MMGDGASTAANQLQTIPLNIESLLLVACSSRIDGKISVSAAAYSGFLRASRIVLHIVLYRVIPRYNATIFLRVKSQIIVIVITKIIVNYTIIIFMRS